jgi:hypothetical protein
MQLGSIASNTIFQGGSGQEPHIDYPYWDYYNKEHWPFPPKHKGEKNFTKYLNLFHQKLSYIYYTNLKFHSE